MVYVTHDQVEAMTLADRIVVLNAGRVEQVGSPLELYHHPANLFVAGFIGSPQMNFIDSEVTQVGPNSVELRLPNRNTFTVPLRPEGVGVGDPVTLGIRPDHLHVAETGLLRGRIELIEQLGENHLLYINSDGVRLTARESGDAKYRMGDDVTLDFSGAQSHLFRRDGDAVPHTGFDLPCSVIGSAEEIGQPTA